MKKEFYISIPDEINSNELENFIINEFHMICCASGAGSAEYTCESKNKPKNFKKKVIKNFGEVTYNNLAFGYFEGED